MADFLTIIHTCKNFEAWKPIYDADAPNRSAAGLADVFLARRMDDLNAVCLIFQVNDQAGAKAFIKSDQLRDAMVQAGVVGTPTIRFRQGEFAPGTMDTYLTLNCKISGIDKFRAGYSMDATDRADAGLTDLGLMQNVEDPDDLLLIWSVDDVERANAFVRSPSLAEHQAKNAGIVGVLEAHYWRR